MIEQRLIAIVMLATVCMTGYVVIETFYYPVTRISSKLNDCMNVKDAEAMARC